jgi:hypothetical protein
MKWKSSLSPLITKRLERSEAIERLERFERPQVAAFRPFASRYSIA